MLSIIKILLSIIISAVAGFWFGLGSWPDYLIGILAGLFLGGISALWMILAAGIWWQEWSIFKQRNWLATVFFLFILVTGKILALGFLFAYRESHIAWGIGECFGILSVLLVLVGCVFYRSAEI